jgi:hypothetical protein
MATFCFLFPPTPKYSLDQLGSGNPNKTQKIGAGEVDVAKSKKPNKTTENFDDPSR